MKARIYCEVTCCICGGLAYKSTYYKNSSTISELKEATKDWIWDDKLHGNLCPECQKELENWNK